MAEKKLNLSSLLNNSSNEEVKITDNVDDTIEINEETQDINVPESETVEEETGNSVNSSETNTIKLDISALKKDENADNIWKADMDLQEQTLKPENENEKINMLQNENDLEEIVSKVNVDDIIEDMTVKDDSEILGNYKSDFENKKEKIIEEQINGEKNNKREKDVDESSKNGTIVKIGSEEKNSEKIVEQNDKIKKITDMNNWKNNKWKQLDNSKANVDWQKKWKSKIGILLLLIIILILTLIAFYFKEELKKLLYPTPSIIVEGQDEELIDTSIIDSTETGSTVIQEPEVPEVIIQEKNRLMKQQILEKYLNKQENNSELENNQEIEETGNIGITDEEMKEINEIISNIVDEKVELIEEIVSEIPGNVEFIEENTSLESATSTYRKDLYEVYSKEKIDEFLTSKQYHPSQVFYKLTGLYWVGNNENVENLYDYVKIKTQIDPRDFWFRSGPANFFAMRVLVEDPELFKYYLTTLEKNVETNETE